MKSEKINKGVYIATTQPFSGKSLVSLGLIHALRERGLNVGYFRPVIDQADHEKRDNHINTVISWFGMDIPYNNSFGFTRNELIRMKGEDADRPRRA